MVGIERSLRSYIAPAMLSINLLIFGLIFVAKAVTASGSGGSDSGIASETVISFADTKRSIINGYNNSTGAIFGSEPDPNNAGLLPSAINANTPDEYDVGSAENLIKLVNLVIPNSSIIAEKLYGIGDARSIGNNTLVTKLVVLKSLKCSGGYVYAKNTSEGEGEGEGEGGESKGSYSIIEGDIGSSYAFSSPNNATTIFDSIISGGSTGDSDFQKKIKDSLKVNHATFIDEEYSISIEPPNNDGDNKTNNTRADSIGDIGNGNGLSPTDNAVVTISKEILITSVEKSESADKSGLVVTNNDTSVLNAYSPEADEIETLISNINPESFTDDEELKKIIGTEDGKAALASLTSLIRLVTAHPPPLNIKSGVIGHFYYARWNSYDILLPNMGSNDDAKALFNQIVVSKIRNAAAISAKTSGNNVVFVCTGE